jgi:hypothetical protein
MMRLRNNAQNCTHNTGTGTVPLHASENTGIDLVGTGTYPNISPARFLQLLHQPNRQRRIHAVKKYRIMNTKRSVIKELPVSHY